MCRSLLFGFPASSHFAGVRTSLSGFRSDFGLRVWDFAAATRAKTATSRRSAHVVGRTGALSLAFALFTGASLAQPLEVSKLPPAAQKRVDFFREVQPILAQHCYACHGP